MLCTFNGTKSQALDLVRVWKEEQAIKERRAKMETFFSKPVKVTAEQEKFERLYFAEVV